MTTELGADPVVFGWLQTTFAFVQLVGGPIVGRIIDTRGARFAIMLSNFSAGLSYLLLGLSTTMPMLFASRLPTLGMHAFHAAQACITQLTTADARAASLGRLSLSYGIGLITGPAMGGFVSARLGYNLTGVIASVVSFATVAATYVMLPSSLVGGGASGSSSSSSPSKSPSSSSSSSTSEGGLRVVLRFFKRPMIRNLLLIKLMGAMGVSIFRSNFSTTAMDKFHLDAQQNGYVMSFVGFLGMGVNTLLVGVVTSKYPEEVIIRSSLLVLSLSFMHMSMSTTIWWLLCSIAPMTMAGTLTGTVVTSSLTKLVTKAEAGTVLGLDMGINALTGVMSPAIGGYIYQNYGFSFIGVTGALLAFTALAYCIAFLQPVSVAVKAESAPPAGVVLKPLNSNKTTGKKFTADGSDKEN
eukprot:TRINITY_DN67102_c3_g1_i1.p1 TRINITY_DN67102_c3_g1~~TRINITY_DN67102_c3_g1_i1.p1  ORF type:complete len:412 (-),score=178.50 TRINITY_DN67102_c3_g1_i1:47-1282(-)